ncbi:hypothetical protein [Reichenbachiella ulvae]|uniref:Calx-beta domain-containing protein n=1 Tax=Reichenbachiella ulvae TaxID=2980104 RepID=A0ABT3CZA6_9BACT|nr:hypothetical protein [Reichenbachiella ulvae]MCV9389035.1 hypothetical protein [Reichenbachiella ulvae]
MKKNNLYILLGLLFLVFSCEELEDPLSEASEVNNFVQFAADTPSEIEVVEGGSDFVITIQAPVSGGEDLLSTVSFSGTAEYGIDFEVVEGPGSNDAGAVISANATEAVIKVPYLPAGGEDLISDQVGFGIRFLTDLDTDGDKTLIVTLDGAVGAETSNLVFDGGRGPIRVSSEITIKDADCPSDLTGTWNSVTTGSAGTDQAYTVTITETSVNGVYDLSDITFGLYTDVYGESDNPVQFTDACDVISVVDQPDVVYGGDVFNATGTVNENGTISISWSNGFGDNGVTTLTKQ